MKVDSLAWYVARASGVTAWFILCGEVFLGLVTSTRFFGPRARPKWLLDLHRFAGGLAIGFVAVHVAGLAADQYVHFGWRELLVPLASRYRPLPVAVGIVSMYLLVAVQVTSLAMRWMPRRWWRAVHSTSFVLFVLTAAHVFTAGTDAVNRVLRGAGLLVGAVFVVLVVYRSARPIPGAVRKREGDPVSMTVMTQ